MRIVVAIHSPIRAWNISPAVVGRVAEHFTEHRFVHLPGEAGLAEALAEAEVAWLSHVTPQQFAAARRLRWIHSPAVGIGGMLFPALVASGVVLTNSRGVQAVPMAEFVLAAMLACGRKLHLAVRAQMERRWAQDDLLAGEPPFFELRGQLAGLVGLGAIGSEVARLASAIGMRVWATRRHPERPRPAEIERVLGPDQLDDLLAAARFVILALPHTSETRDLIGEPQLRRMRPDAFLINVGRGKLVVEDALTTALRERWIAGAVLDVFDHEPLPSGHPLWDTPNMIVTPHVSYASSAYWDKVAALFEENLRRFLTGQELVNVVDKRKGY